MKKTILFSCIFLLTLSCTAQDTILKRNGERVLAKVTEINSSEVKYKKFTYQDGPTYVEKKADIELITYSTGLKERFERQPTTAAPPPKQQPNADYYGGRGETTTGNKIYEFGTRYKYQYGIISEREMQSILMNTNDKHIMGLVQQSKQAHGMQFIGFAGIPLGIAAGYCALLSTTPGTGTYNPQTGSYNYTNPNQDGLQVAATICLVGAIACPVASGIFRARRTSYNREAVNLYNQKY